MSTPLTDSINELTNYANEITGASDTTLSDAVHTLAQGYVSRYDYLSGIEWEEKKYINDSGTVGENGNLHYTVDAICLPQGTYLLYGIQTANTSLNYRIHKYDSDDNWVKQIEAKGFSKGYVALIINVSDAQSYLRFSIASNFSGALIKFFDI